MKKQDTRLYAIPIHNKDRALNETSIYRHPKSLNTDIYQNKLKVKTLHDSYLHCLDTPKQEFLGKREKDKKGKLSKFKFRSYQQVFRDAEKFGSGMVNLKMASVNNEDKNNNLKFIGFYTKTTYEVLVSDIACCLYNYVIIPLYDTLGEQANDYIFNQTKLDTLIINKERMDDFINSALDKNLCKYIKNLIVVGEKDLPFKKEWVKRTRGRLNIYKWQDVKEIGEKNVQKWAKVTPDTVYAFSYTSGTTGNPKGAMISHGNLISLYASITERVDLTQMTYLSYLPLAHILERSVFNVLIYFKGRIGIFSGTKKLLFEDIKLLRPTLFISVPRVFNKIYTKIMSTFKEKSCCIQAIFNNGLKTKLKNLKEKNKIKHWFYDLIIFNKIKAIMGGRVKYFITGGAPISPHIFDFFKVVFQAHFAEVYGQTEGSGSAFSSFKDDLVSGHVGGPLLKNEFKLVDVPEMGYSNQDLDEQGNSRPRGEIWVRGPGIIKEYYKLPQKNKETFIDGWLLSGDIGQIIAPNNRLQIIDRKKNIFKLSQGEYIAPEKLETAYRKANSLISNIFVYGDSLRDNLVGIVNIETGCLDKVANELGVNKNGENLNEKIGEKLLEKFMIIKEEKKFNRLEEIKKLKVISEDWLKMGFITVTLKNKRHAIFVHYEKDLHNLYN